MKAKLTYTLLIPLLVASCTAYRPAGTAHLQDEFYVPPRWEAPLDYEANPAKQKPANFAPNFAASPTKGGWLAPAFASNSPYSKGEGFTPRFEAKGTEPQEQMKGYASWYGPGFHGKQTANGEEYDQNGMTAAHKFLPMNTWVKVTNEQNGKTAIVRINDRGPYKKNRILDLTKEAAKALGFFNQGTAPVRLRVLKYPKGYDPAKGLEPYKQVVVQVAVFTDSTRAMRLKEELSRRYGAIPFLVDQPKRGSWHVVAGPYDERTLAAKISGKLKANGISGFVRSYRK